MTEPEAGYNDSGVPDFDYVRERIETRFATSEGAGELVENESATLDEKMADRDRAAGEKLEQIRRSMRGE